MNDAQSPSAGRVLLVRVPHHHDLSEGSALSAIERLHHLFAKYDREKAAFLEYVRREGQQPLIITDVVRTEIDHADESRPE